MAKKKTIVFANSPADSLRGKSITPAYGPDELSLVFFKIRACRDRNQRRSLMRRARLALATRADLTPAEQHEIMSVWSRADVQHIDSPAMRKLLRAPGTQAREWEVQPARQHMRAAFDASGQRRARVKKPGQARLDFGDAANDQIFSGTVAFLFPIVSITTGTAMAAMKAQASVISVSTKIVLPPFRAHVAKSPTSFTDSAQSPTAATQSKNLCMILPFKRTL